MEVVTKDDLAEVFNKFVRKSVAEHLQPLQKEYESSMFRQPELYGLPVFVIGYGGRTIAYLGQYIAHKIVKARLDGKVETRWRILTGFVRVVAKHVEDDVYIEVFANGVPSVGAVEWLNNRDQFVLIEDRKELHEIECKEESIVNLSGVMRYEDPVILIDLTGLLKELPSDVLGRYNELIAVYTALQKQVYDMEQIIDDLKVELETTKAENRVLRTQVYRLNTRIMAVSGALMHYKSELLKMKELMQFHLERLEAVRDGKERLESVINDYRDFLDFYAETASQIVERIAQLEGIGRETERALEDVRKVKSKEKEGEG